MIEFSVSDVMSGRGLKRPNKGIFLFPPGTVEVIMVHRSPSAIEISDIRNIFLFPNTGKIANDQEHP